MHDFSGRVVARAWSGLLGVDEQPLANTAEHEPRIARDRRSVSRGEPSSVADRAVQAAKVAELPAIARPSDRRVLSRHARIIDRHEARLRATDERASGQREQL